MEVTEVPTAADSTRPTVAEVARYLSLNRWSVETSGSVNVYYPPGDVDLQIALPAEAGTSRNVDAQIDDAVRVIAHFEKRTVRETLANLTGTGADTIAVRLLPETPPGTAPLAAAHEAIAALRELVVGAASALRNDSLILPARPAAGVDDYANRTHFSTRPGSFIVDLTLPLTVDAVSRGVQEPSEQAAFFAAEEIDPTPRHDPNPFGRAVSRRIRSTVTNALQAADQVTTGDLRLTAFTEPGRNLGNATELEAISKLGGSLGTDYQIRFTDTALAPGAEPVEIVTATPAQQRILVEAAALIREQQSFEDITLNGYVIRLVKKRPNPHGPGEVTIRATVEEIGATVNCWVHLGADDYEHALNAHNDGLEIHATGTLDFNKNRWRLRDVTSFNAPT